MRRDGHCQWLLGNDRGTDGYDDVPEHHEGVDKVRGERGELLALGLFLILDAGIDVGTVNDELTAFK